MRATINLLIQLQELIIIRDEQKVAAGGQHLEELDESIRSMTRQLPPDVQALFEKLHKRDRVIIVPIAETICSICGMKLPISLIQAVRLAREIQCCPTCAHMLFYPESTARRLRQPSRRTEPPKVGISRFSAPTLMIPQLESEDKEGVIRELASRMEQEGFIDSADKLVEGVMRREAILGTAVDHGLAFPHVRGVEGGGLAFALGISRKGIAFGGPEGAPTRILFLIAIPTAASAFYLKLLSGLTETFMKAEARKALMAEKEPDKLWKALVKATRATIK